MLGSNILDVAIGVVFIYLLLSLICTAVNETIASLLDKRSSNLFEGIKNLLNDPAFTGLAQQLYSHGMIDSISRDASNAGTANRPPSYIPAAHFSLAMIDILGSRGVVAAAHGDLLAAAETADDHYEVVTRGTTIDADAVKQAKAEQDAATAALTKAQQDASAARDQAIQAASENPGDAGRAQAAALAKDAAAAADAAVNMLNARRAAIALSQNPKNATLLRNASDTLETALATARRLAADCPDPLGNLQAAVDRLPAGHTRESLHVLIDKTRRDATAAKDQIQAFQKNIETWFDDSMARVGGWYKRWTQRCLFAIAVVIVVLANADTLKLTRRLSSDAALRSGLVAAAEASAKSVPAQNNSSSAADQTQTVVNVLRDQAAGIYIPLGVGEWRHDWADFHSGVSRNDKLELLFATRDGLSVVASKLLGLLFSIFAVSLGAPFWFDTLSKVANVRGTGTPPGEPKVNARADGPPSPNKRS